MKIIFFLFFPILSSYSVSEKCRKYIDPSVEEYQKIISQLKTDYSLNITTGFYSEKRLQEHYGKHKNDFEDITDIQSYKLRAIKFASERSEHIFTYLIPKESKIYRFNEETNEILIIEKNHIQSYYRARRRIHQMESNWEYFLSICLGKKS